MERSLHFDCKDTSESEYDDVKTGFWGTNAAVTSQNYGTAPGQDMFCWLQFKPVDAFKVPMPQQLNFLIQNVLTLTPVQSLRQRLMLVWVNFMGILLHPKHALLLAVSACPLLQGAHAAAAQLPDPKCARPDSSAKPAAAVDAGVR